MTQGKGVGARADHRVVQGKPRTLMRLVVGQGSRRYEAWYWFTANGRTTPNYYEQQLWLLVDSIHRKPMAGSLVRISTPLEDSTASRQRLESFVSAFETKNEASGFQVARHGL